MGPGMMRGGAGHESDHEGMVGMMREGMGSEMMMRMCRRMMGSRMMGSGMVGMMGSETSGMHALFGSHVEPVMNLSVDDVRTYLGERLGHLGNKRLKLGDIKSDDATITADIVTADNSLVQRLKVDRHTGAIDYES